MAARNDYHRGFWAEGVPFIWISGMAVLVLLAIVIGFLGLIFAKGAGHFWPAPMAQVTLKSGSSVMGPVMETEAIPHAAATRSLFKIGNRDVYGLDFRWVDDAAVEKREYPPDAAVIERSEYGDMHGFIQALREGGAVTARAGPDFHPLLEKKIARAAHLKEEIKKAADDVEHAREPLAKLEVDIRLLEDGSEAGTPEAALKLEKLNAEYDALALKLGDAITVPEQRIESLRKELDAPTLEVALADGQVKTMPLKDVRAFYLPNRMGLSAKAGHYLCKVWDFLWTWPRESNTEGGVFPAIFGTVMMVFIMVVIGAPFGVMAALYMNEYAKPGFFLNLVRLGVNNLAGVPSIVFGIFGLGFFIYFIGGGIDRLFFTDKLPEPTYGTGGILWASLTLALLTVPVVVVATLEGLAAVPRANREGALALGSTKWQMLWNVVLPNSMPGILTGVILAISRATGEVAPLMITGVVKLVAELPVDAGWPFLHLDRKFMHLGFHIYDVGFQSPNVEAAKPMVYTTTGLLLVIVVTLNLVAILLRNRLRKTYKGAAL